MASPPFNINQSLPGDSDIVSQHPPNARTMRDVVESWLLVNHDTNGNHARIDMPRIASPTTPAAAIDVLYVTTRGRLKIKHPDATEEFVGLPPGAKVMHSVASAPVGYLYADGSAVSRATYADLFDAIGTNFGIGDGSTTFNLPDWRGRSDVGVDGGAGRITTATMSAVTVGGVGGSETKALTATNIPAVSVSSVTGSVTVSTVSGSITGTAAGQTGSISGSASGGTVSGSVSTGLSGALTSSALTVTGGGSNIPLSSSAISSLQTAGSPTTNITPNNSSGTWSGVTSLNGTITNTAIIGNLTNGTLNSGTISGAATVTGTFSGSSSSVTGTFSGTGSGTFSGTGTTAGGASGTAFSIMQPSMVLYPMIKT